MMKKVFLKNKPLSLCEHDKKIFIGDAHGEIYFTESPFILHKHVLTANAPVSAIAFLDNNMIFSTWDGEVLLFNKIILKSVKLGRDPVKCLTIFDSKIFVSVDKKLFVLDKELNIMEKYDTDYKITCMDVVENELVLGLMTGIISKYKNGYIPGKRTRHETNILSVYKNLSGSSDSTLRNEKEILYSGSGWIRSIYDENLFSSGKDVVFNKEVLYSHDDEVMKVIKIENIIFSIGLDYCYNLYSENGMIYTSEEEDEIMKSLN